MKRFRLRQDLSITEEDGKPVKNFSVDMWVATEGFDDNTVKDMFEMFANGFTGLIEETDFSSDADKEKVLFDESQERSKGNGKKWF